MTDLTSDTAPAARRPRGAGSRRMAAGLLLAVLGLAPAAVHAQQAAAPAPAATGGGTPVSPFGNFGGGKGPIQIESNELEVQDKKGIAIFTGNVVAKQGDSVLQAQKLVVYYSQPPASGGAGADKAKKPSATAAAEGQQQQQIERLEATGRVLLSEKDQTATGSAATYSAKDQTMVMTGDVVLTQGGNVVRGNKLVVHLDTGEARVFADKRVQMLLVPSQAPSAPGSAPAQ